MSKPIVPDQKFKIFACCGAIRTLEWCHIWQIVFKSIHKMLVSSMPQKVCPVKERWCTNGTCYRCLIRACCHFLLWNFYLLFLWQLPLIHGRGLKFWLNPSWNNISQFTYLHIVLTVLPNFYWGQLQLTTDHCSFSFFSRFGCALAIAINAS